MRSFHRCRRVLCADRLYVTGCPTITVQTKHPQQSSPPALIMTSCNSELDRESHITSLVQDALTNYLQGHMILDGVQDFDCRAMAASGAATVASAIIERSAWKATKWTRITVSGGTASASRKRDILNNQELREPNGTTDVLDNPRKPEYCKPMDLEFTMTDDAGEELKVTITDFELPLTMLAGSEWRRDWPYMCLILGQDLERNVPSSVVRTLTRELRDKQGKFEEFLRDEKIDVTRPTIFLRPAFNRCTVSSIETRGHLHSWNLVTELWAGTGIQEHLGEFEVSVETPTAGDSYAMGTTLAAMGLRFSLPVKLDRLDRMRS